VSTFAAEYCKMIVGDWMRGGEGDWNGMEEGEETQNEQK
jgi:hypothetical protein